MRGGTRGRWMGRVGALVAAVTLGLLVTAGPALAHNVLISSNPTDGATLDSAPATVSFTFDQPIQNFDPVLNVLGPNGNSFSGGAPTIDGVTISVPFEAGPAGAYRAVYRIVSADGHPVTGQITFTLSDAAAGTATGKPTGTAANTPTAGSAAPDSTSTSPSTSSGLGVWLWVGIAVAAVIVLVAIVIALRKPSRPH